MKIVNIALFASGSGTNVENVYNYFADNDTINVCCVLCNKPDAYVIQRAKNLNLDFMTFNRTEYDNSSLILDYLESKKVDLIVLAGFLWLIPEYLINKYQDGIINIHPALLPKYGGKGMYGSKVHQEVYKNHEKETGITIHYVNKHYDEGAVIFQKSVDICNEDTPESIAKKVHQLEYLYLPLIIERICLNLQPKNLTND